LPRRGERKKKSEQKNNGVGVMGNENRKGGLRDHILKSNEAGICADLAVDRRKLSQWESRTNDRKGPLLGRGGCNARTKLRRNERWPAVWQRGSNFLRKVVLIHSRSRCLLLNARGSTKKIERESMGQKWPSYILGTGKLTSKSNENLKLGGTLGVFKKFTSGERDNAQAAPKDGWKSEGP